MYFAETTFGNFRQILSIGKIRRLETKDFERKLWYLVRIGDM